ncbi:uncharacterized protein LOC131046388 [Cryptomeria japonica]|uniref:uncharacterized protein LOC131046388 n=1 Tax=Cryptomeria japonica TaxID=3369 RepID=UPI0027DA92C4|nr:uncharacterized protein LOC131046388 [Cryptomeria japonica]
MERFNLQNGRELRHFSHPHILKLSHAYILKLSTWEGGASGEQLYCKGCIKPVKDGLVYTCKPCNFYLHLSCAKIPEQINHPADNHVLNLLSSPWIYAQGACACDACGQQMRYGFSFHCSLCQLDLHPSCANLPMKVNHPYHPEHTLKLYFVSPYEDKSFTCCVCNERSKSLWHYHCSECLYDVHVACSCTHQDSMNQFSQNYNEQVKRLVERINAYNQELRAPHMPMGNPRYPYLYSGLTRPSMFYSSSSFHVQQQQRPPFPSAYENMNYSMLRKPGMELIMQNLMGGSSNSFDFMSMMGSGGGDGFGSSEDLSSILNMISSGGGGGNLSGILGSMFGFGFF